MRDYQIVGVKWLLEQFDSGVPAILGDEMGLGKTLQVVALLGFLHQNGIKGPHLVVSPLSVMPSWEAEFARWCPWMRVVRFYGSEKERTHLRQMLNKGGFDVCVCTYDIMVSEISWISIAQHYTYVVLDEAHKIKGDKSLVSRSARRLHSSFRLLLTGTPLQNNLRELWSLLNFLFPEVIIDEMEPIFQAAFQLPSSFQIKKTHTHTHTHTG
eukprot:GHVR01092077.1.p1 GENE.GHVR01092077.1~~GHVR01092077.1.p1  ORF type:complete len:212 (+),score=57.65 GHVR01092077.1:166-801(+)